MRPCGPAKVRAVNCVVCGLGEIREGSATLVFKRGGLTTVFRGVPAEVCETCGED